MAIATGQTILSGTVQGQQGQVDTVAKALLESRGSEEGSRALAGRLASIAGQSIALICNPLFEGRFEVRVGSAEVIFKSVSHVERRALLAALGSVESQVWRVYLQVQIQQDPSLGKRLSALEVLGEHGHAIDVPNLFHWAEGRGSNGRIPRELRQSFGYALSSLLKRDEEGVFAAARLYHDCPLALTPGLIGALGRCQSSAALVQLSALLGQNLRVDALILRELTVMGGRLKHPLDETAQQNLSHALSSSDPVVRLQAIAACRAMECTPAVPKLIRMLASGSSNEGKQARLALEEITGEVYSSGSGPWSDWLQGSMEWWDEEAPALMFDVRSGNPAQVCQALKVLSRHRFYRHRLVEVVAVGLQNEQESVIGVACAALGYMGSYLAVGPLLDSLGSSNTQALRQAALQALVQITGENHGEDPADWQKAGW